LAVWAVAANVGPGLLTLCLFAALVFMVVVPLLQIALLRTRRLKGKHLEVCALALVIGGVIVLAPASFGVFSFY
jgi:hypothetical protein